MKFSFRQLEYNLRDKPGDVFCVFIALVSVIFSFGVLAFRVSPWFLLVIPIGAILRTLYLMKE